MARIDLLWLHAPFCFAYFVRVYCSWVMSFFPLKPIYIRESNSVFLSRVFDRPKSPRFDLTGMESTLSLIQ